MFAVADTLGLRGAIRAIRHNGIQSVGHGKHSGAKRNLIAFQSARVACAIKAFLMGVYNVASFLQEGNLLEHLVAAIAVLSHDSYFFGIQSARLAQDGIGNSHLSNVMEKGAAGNYPDVIVGKSHGAGNSDGKGGYSFGVSFGLGIFKIESITQSLQCDVIGALQV